MLRVVGVSLLHYRVSLRDVSSTVESDELVRLYNGFAGVSMGQCDSWYRTCCNDCTSGMRNASPCNAL
jgi:hypothetical protein